MKTVGFVILFIFNAIYSIFHASDDTQPQTHADDTSTVIAEQKASDQEANTYVGYVKN